MFEANRDRIYVETRGPVTRPLNICHVECVGRTGRPGANGGPQSREILEHTPRVSKSNRLSLRNNRLKLKTAGKLPIVLDEFIEYILI